MNYLSSALDGKLREILMFGIVGGIGFIIDTGLLLLLGCQSLLADNVSLAKGIASEVAVISNFFLNESWTFKTRRERLTYGRLRRFIEFNGIALLGVGIGVVMLTILSTLTQLNLLIANVITVFAVSALNYSLSTLLGPWRLR